MLKNGIPDSFPLLENEEVLIKKSRYREISKYCAYLLFLITIVSYLLSVLFFSFMTNLPFVLLLIFFISITFLFGIAGLEIPVGYFTEINYSLLITNIRIMKFPYKRFLPQIYKIKEIRFENVDYITFDWRVIIIVEKSSGGQAYFKDDEKEYKSRPKGINSILFNWRMDQESDLRKRVLDLLIELTKAKKHPHISDLYISTI